MRKPVKYLPLGAYLGRRSTASMTLSFSEVEKVIGAMLPPSARRRHEWWANEMTHAQSRAWREAGYAAFPNLHAGTVTFRRIAPKHTE
jgi:hypothetical protein